MQSTVRQWGADRDKQIASLPLFDPVTERKKAAMRGDITADQRRIDEALTAHDPSRLRWADMAVLLSVPSPLRKLNQIVQHLTATGAYAAR
jgi:hypothetical protein